MINETMIYTIATSSAAFLFGTLIALLFAGRKTKAVQQQMAIVTAKLEDAMRSSELLQHDLTTANDKLRISELDNSRLNADLISTSARKSELELNLRMAKQECDKSDEKLQAQFRRQADTEIQLEKATTTAEKTQEQLMEVKTNLVTQREKADKLQADLGSMQVDYRELKTSLDERERAFEKQIAQFEEQKLALTKEFENLANRIFEEKGRSFTETSKVSIDSMLKPFREQIDGFQKRVDQVHSESVQGTTQLKEQIKGVLDVGLKIQDEATNLTKALKGDKKAQGSWSEMQAELILEASGLQKGREFEREANFKNDEGKDQRPDFIVKLPGNKHIIIDSKISLNRYVESVSAEADSERQTYLKAHVEAIRKHVKDLSAKNYQGLNGINCLEFVFMFIGNEPAYLAAFNFEPNLFQEAYNKGIAIVTPSTLHSSLRIVSHLWSIDKQNNHTRELAEQASKVYEKLRVFVSKMEKLGGQIETVQKTYSDSWSTLKDGKGSLTKQVSRFVEMGVAVKEKLPLSVLEGSELTLLVTNDDQVCVN